ncbi:hypothetical protein C8F01DRAFT_270942 [Mycena amicta]|nr:hypothetical protein C8F01DRAFT_270942 [Mycena amicta]
MPSSATPPVSVFDLFFPPFPYRAISKNCGRAPELRTCHFLLLLPSESGGERLPTAHYTRRSIVCEARLRLRSFSGSDSSATRPIVSSGPPDPTVVLRTLPIESSVAFYPSLESDGRVHLSRLWTLLPHREGECRVSSVCGRPFCALSTARRSCPEILLRPKSPDSVRKCTRRSRKMTWSIFGGTASHSATAFFISSQHYYAIQSSTTVAICCRTRAGLSALASVSHPDGAYEGFELAALTQWTFVGACVHETYRRKARRAWSCLIDSILARHNETSDRRSSCHDPSRLPFPPRLGFAAPASDPPRDGNADSPPCHFGMAICSSSKAHQLVKNLRARGGPFIPFVSTECSPPIRSSR